VFVFCGNNSNLFCIFAEILVYYLLFFIAMGMVYAEITLKNAWDVTSAARGIIQEQEVRQTTVIAMVDTGAWTLAINEKTRKELGLSIVGDKISTLADGSVSHYQTTEPVLIYWKNRDAVCTAVLLPDADDILLGALPLEAMDLIVNPLREEVVGAHGDEALYKLK
jgi:predicted aspartyl protease